MSQHAPNIICKNCGNHFHGKFCNACGEKNYDEHDKTLGHVAEEAVHFITHLDGTLPVSFATIFKRPGLYSLEYCNGIRRKYFKPVSLFLVCVVLYLLFPLFKGLNMTLSTYVSADFDYSWFGKPLVQKKLATSHYTYQQLAEKYDEASPKFSKILLLLYLPLTALTLSILFYKRRKFFFDHFILATEFNIFMIAFSYLLFPLLFYLLSLLVFWVTKNPLEISEIIVASVAGTALTLFCAKSFRRFYGEKWWLTILKMVLFLAVYLFIIEKIYKIFVLITVLLFV